jgi:hypothetical protein
VKISRKSEPNFKKGAADFHLTTKKGLQKAFYTFCMFLMDAYQNAHLSIKNFNILFGIFWRYKTLLFYSFLSFYLYKIFKFNIRSLLNKAISKNANFFEKNKYF